MTAFPSNADLTTVPSTHGSVRAALGALRDATVGLVGADGTIITALQTLGAFATNYVAKTGAYSVLTTDRGKVIDATSGTWTLTLPPVSGLGGFSFEFRNSGSGTVTIDGNAAELVDGATTLAVPPGNAVLLICTGTAWVTCWMMRPGATVAFSGAPSASVPFVFAAGAVGAPSVTFSGDLDTGMWSPGANLLAWSTAGLEALRVNGSQNLFVGGTASISGIGGARITSLGDSAATGQWAIGQFNNGVAGPTFAFAKARGASVGTYTIVTAGDTLGNIEAWGADGTTMVLSARLQAYSIGTMAAGDIRGAWRVQTGSGPGALTTRLTVDDTTIAATLPISTTGVLTAGFAAHGAAVTAMALATAPHASLTPNSTRTLTTTVPPAGTLCSLEINTSGTTSYTLTFGTGFRTTGTLVTGTVTAKRFTIYFISNGTDVNELGRTVAM